jgi:hypothetical protein
MWRQSIQHTWSYLFLEVSRMTFCDPIIIFNRIFGYKAGVRFKDLIFISYAGMIRGAVAFGLVLRIDKGVTHRPVIVTTSLALVVLTTIFLGSTVGTVQHFLFKDEAAEKKAAEFASRQHLEGADGDHSHHEHFLHPNEENS